MPQTKEYDPETGNLDDQWEDEEIKFFLRKHWMGFLQYIFIIGFMIIFSFTFILVIGFIYGWESGMIRAVFVLNGIFQLFILALFLTAWIIYYFDILIVTNQRIIKIEQKALFDRQVSALGLLRIQNITAQAEGVLQTLFNFGTVVVETAGESKNSIVQKEGKFDFSFLPNPYRLSEDILKLHDQLVDKTRQANYSAIGEGDLRSTGVRVPTPVPKSVDTLLEEVITGRKKPNRHYFEDKISSEEESVIQGNGSSDSNNKW